MAYTGKFPAKPWKPKPNWAGPLHHDLKPGEHMTMSGKIIKTTPKEYYNVPLPKGYVIEDNIGKIAGGGGGHAGSPGGFASGGGWGGQGGAGGAGVGGGSSQGDGGTFVQGSGGGAGKPSDMVFGFDIKLDEGLKPGEAKWVPVQPPSDVPIGYLTEGEKYTTNNGNTYVGDADGKPVFYGKTKWANVDYDPFEADMPKKTKKTKKPQPLDITTMVDPNGYPVWSVDDAENRPMITFYANGKIIVGDDAVPSMAALAVIEVLKEKWPQCIDAAAETPTDTMLEAGAKVLAATDLPKSDYMDVVREVWKKMWGVAADEKYNMDKKLIKS